MMMKSADELYAKFKEMEEGGPKFQNHVPIERETIEKAIKFVEKLAIECSRIDVAMLPPDFCPGMNGDVDIQWNMEHWALLVTVPWSDDGLYGYFGRYLKGLVDFERCLKGLSSNVEIDNDKDEFLSIKDIAVFLKQINEQERKRVGEGLNEKQAESLVDQD